MEPAVDHPQAAVLEAISRILDSDPTIRKLAFQDLYRRKKSKQQTGAKSKKARNNQYINFIKVTR